ncbi:MAG: LysR family transcriptional regulator [Coriobacteriia bacterium]|nr:LysR family transcriptional regulator [Coriobacteriia bacterium]MBS5477157.1 LysR family transcriptional regulator [Coriobacteriia bacterium]
MVDLDIHQLEYFVQAARASSYSQAARDLFVTPQAISRSIQLLEARMGVRLFRRTPSGIALTDAGSACLKPAQEALEALSRLLDTTQRYRQTDSLTIVLGIHSLCFRENGGSISRADLLTFQKQHSALTLTFIEMAGNAIIDALRTGAIDIGITVPPREVAESTDLRRWFLKTFRIAAITSRGFAEAFAHREGENEFITVQDLTNGELILFSDETEYNNALVANARTAGIDLPISSLRISPHGDIGFISDSHLYVVRPLQHALRTITNEGLSILPIRDAHNQDIRMPLELLMRQDRILSDEERSLLSFIQQRYR